MRFRKKPVEIEAEQYIGREHPDPKGACRCMAPAPHLHTMHEGQRVTLEPGDWVIAEPDGIHFYPCKPDVFADRYEPVE